MVFGLGTRQSPWFKEAKRSIKQMHEHADPNSSSAPSPDERIAQAADDLSRSAKLTEQIAHARSALSKGGEERKEAVKAYADEAQLEALESELHEALESVREAASAVFEESTARLIERMNKLAKKLTSTTRTAPPPYVSDTVAILEQLKRERDPAQEHTLTERMRKNLRTVTAQIEQLKTTTTTHAESDDPDSWMQTEIEREKNESINTQITILEEMRTIIETFLEKRSEPA